MVLVVYLHDLKSVFEHRYNTNCILFQVSYRRKHTLSYIIYNSEMKEEFYLHSNFILNIVSTSNLEPHIMN